MWWRVYCWRSTKSTTLPALPHPSTTSMQTLFLHSCCSALLGRLGINDFPCRYNPIKTLKTSFLGTMNMLGMAKRTRARFLLTSTSEVKTSASGVLAIPDTATYRSAGGLKAYLYLLIIATISKDCHVSSSAHKKHDLVYNAFTTYYTMTLMCSEARSVCVASLYYSSSDPLRE